MVRDPRGDLLGERVDRLGVKMQLAHVDATPISAAGTLAQSFGSLGITTSFVAGAFCLSGIARLATKDRAARAKLGCAPRH